MKPRISIKLRPKILEAVILTAILVGIVLVAVLSKEKEQGE